MIKRSLFFAFFLTTSLCMGAISPKEQAQSVSELKKMMADQHTRVLTLQSHIQELESKLNQGNKRYKSVYSTRREIEILVGNIETDLNKLKEVQEEQQNKLGPCLKVMALESLNTQGDLESLVLQKILKKNLDKITEQMKVTLAQRSDLDKKLGNLKEKAMGLDQTETEILGILGKLEQEKMNLVKDYLEDKKDLERIQSQLDQRLASIKVDKIKNENKVEKNSEKNRDLKFRPPLDEFAKLSYEKKGITYRYRGKTVVLAPQKGKVIYKGRLSTYGNVVMIDHGDETRTVLLGEFNPIVEKGDLVESGQNVGLTREELTSEGSIYFEVRKKDKAMNTILLIDRKYLDQNNKIST